MRNALQDPSKLYSRSKCIASLRGHSTSLELPNGHMSAYVQLDRRSAAGPKDDSPALHVVSSYLLSFVPSLFFLGGSMTLSIRPYSFAAAAPR